MIRGVVNGLTKPGLIHGLLGSSESDPFSGKNFVQAANNTRHPYTLSAIGGTVQHHRSRHRLSLDRNHKSLALTYVNYAAANGYSGTKEENGTLPITVSVGVKFDGNPTWFTAPAKSISAGGENRWFIDMTSVYSDGVPGGSMMTIVSRVLSSEGQSVPLSTLGMPFFCEGYITDSSAAINYTSGGYPGEECAFTATLSGGDVVSVSVDNGGSGLSSATSWIIAHDAFEDGTYGYKVIGSATIVDGVVTAVTVTDGVPPAGKQWNATPPNITLAGAGTFSVNTERGTYTPALIESFVDDEDSAKSLLLVVDSLGNRAGDGSYTSVDQYNNREVYEIALANRCGSVAIGFPGGYMKHAAMDGTGEQTQAYYPKTFGLYRNRTSHALLAMGTNDMLGVLTDCYGVSVTSTAENYTAFTLHAGLALARLRGDGSTLVSIAKLPPRVGTSAAAATRITTLLEQTNVTDTWGSEPFTSSGSAATFNAAVHADAFSVDWAVGASAIDIGALASDVSVGGDRWKWRVDLTAWGNPMSVSYDGVHMQNKVPVSGYVNQGGISFVGKDATFKASLSELQTWTPADIPNLLLWLDATDATTITSSGGEVSEWADKRLNGTVVTQTVTGKKPKTGIDTINGKNAIYFDGIDDFFDLPSAVRDIGKGANCVFIVMRSDHIAGEQSKLFTLTDGGTGTRLMVFFSSSTAFFWRNSDATNAGTIQQNITRDTNAHIIGGRRNGTALGTSLRSFYDGVEGVDAAKYASDTPTMLAGGLGAGPAGGTANAFKGAIQAVYVIGSYPDNATLNKLAQYQNAISGTTWTPLA